MRDYLYFIKWNEKCLDKLGIEVALNDESGGLLIRIDGDYRDLVNKALNCSFTVYARYYRFNIIKYGPLNPLLDALKPLDVWIEDGIMNLVVNPLSIDIETVARAFREYGFNVVLISEEDVEYSTNNE